MDFLFPSACPMSMHASTTHPAALAAAAIVFIRYRCVRYVGLLSGCFGGALLDAGRLMFRARLLAARIAADFSFSSKPMFIGLVLGMTFLFPDLISANSDFVASSLLHVVSNCDCKELLA